LIYDLIVFFISTAVCANKRLAILDKLSIFFLIGTILYSTMPNFKRNIKILMEGNLRRRLG